jgi:predicted permease
VRPPLRNLFRSLFRGRQREAELEAEIRFHLEAAAEQYRAQGLAAGEARRRARLDFGGEERAREETRDAWAGARLATLGRDARVALRGFRKRPAYAATVVVTLALAVGAATAIFGALWAVVVRPLPFERDDRLVVVRWAERGGDDEIGLSPLEVADFRQASRALAGLAEQHTMTFTLLGGPDGGEPRRVQTAVVSPDWFRLLGVRPVLGRDFVAGDDSHSAPAVLLLSHRFWRGELGGDPALLGAEFSMNDRVHTVVGVLPPLPAMPDDIDVYMPVSACPFRSGPHWSGSRTARGLTAVARLRDGFELEQAERDLAVVAARLAASHPAAYPAERGLAPRLVPLRDAVTVRARPTLWLLVGAATFVLLLVVASLTNLSLAQHARREGELAMRAALGGSRARLGAQIALESALLGLAGGVLGIGFAAACQGLLARFLARLTPRAFEIALGWPTALAAVALAVAIGVAVGLLPALGRRRDLSAALRAEGANATAGGRSLRLRDALVVVQVAVSFVLLIGAGLLLRSLWNLERVAPGFAHAEVVTLDLPHNWTKYPEEPAQIAYAERLLAAVRAVPGVESAALADTYPLHRDLPFSRRVEPGRAEFDAELPGPSADFRIVSSGYFETVGVPVVAGRPLDEGDHRLEDPVVVVNSALARALFPGRDPLGEHLRFAQGTLAWRIVGVVADVRQRGLDREPEPEAYAPLAITGGGGFSLLVRTPAGLALVPSLRAAIRGVDAEQPIVGVRTLAAARSESLAEPRTTAALLAIAAALALLVAAAGLAGLLAYSLGQRHRELGIRLALGATRGDIARLVLGRTAALVGAGALLGLGGALLAARGLDAMLFGLAANDPATYAAVASVLVGAASISALPSLRRALATPPSLALRVT